MTQASAEWSFYPMGPVTREYLGIADKEYRGHNRRPTPEEDRAFQAFLADELTRRPPFNMEECVGLLEELAGMRMGALALKLGQECRHLPIEEDFRALLALGSASMIEGEWEEAAELLKAAQTKEPAEPAPYNNLAEIFFRTRRNEEAKEWIVKALRLSPNLPRLWEMMAMTLLDEDKASAGDKLLNLAREVKSFGGLSIAAEVIAPEDPLLKAQWLEERYVDGERSNPFLIEYTAALGVAGQFQKIPPIVREAEKYGKEKPHWQLFAHAAQAHFALAETDAAAPFVAKVKASKGVPPQVVQELETVYEQESGNSAPNVH